MLHVSILMIDSPQLTFTCSNLPIEKLEMCEICSKLTIKTPEQRD